MSTSAARVAILYFLRTAKEFDTPEGLKQYLKDHPDADEARHTVKKPDSGKKPEKKGPSKPPPTPDAAKRTKGKPPPIPEDAKKAPEGDKSKGGGKQEKPSPDKPQGRLEAWKTKFKNLTDSARQFVEKSPKAVKHFLGDKEFRKHTIQEATDHLREMPAKSYRSLLETAKEEKKEFKTAARGIGKVLSGKKMSKKERHAFKTVATHLAITAAATASMATGPLAGAAMFAKSIATHIAAKSAGKALENSHTLYELEHIGHGVAHLLKHIASEDSDKKKVSPEEAMVNLVLASVIEVMENLDDKDYEEILNNMENADSEGAAKTARVMRRCLHNT